MLLLLLIRYRLLRREICLLQVRYSLLLPLLILVRLEHGCEGQYECQSLAAAGDAGHVHMRSRQDGGDSSCLGQSQVVSHGSTEIGFGCERGTWTEAGARRWRSATTVSAGGGRPRVSQASASWGDRFEEEEEGAEVEVEAMAG
jgi:hypothetical protein